MLLSIPTWLVHISSMTEWLWAITLFYRYGKLIKRNDIKNFGLMMIPHWIGGMFVIFFHLSGDEQGILLDTSKVVNLLGSLALLWAAYSINEDNPTLITDASVPNSTEKAFFSAGVTIGISPWLLDQLSNDPNAFPNNTENFSGWIKFIFQLSSITYLLFLILLLKKFLRAKSVLSGLTIFGFWFVLVFLAVTLTCIYIAINVNGARTLTHDDFLHGFAESFLTISNLMIALGVKRKYDEAKIKLNAG